jgi:hypothetical protein
MQTPFPTVIKLIEARPLFSDYLDKTPSRFWKTRSLCQRVTTCHDLPMQVSLARPATAINRCANSGPAVPNETAGGSIQESALKPLAMRYNGGVNLASAFPGVQREDALAFPLGVRPCVILTPFCALPSRVAGAS